MRWLKTYLKLKFLPEEVSWFRVVHQLDNLSLVRGIDRRHRNVSHGTEFTAVVQVLVLQAEKVPDEPTHNLQTGKQGDHDLDGDVDGAIVVPGLDDVQVDPWEADHQVLHDGKVVIIPGKNNTKNV